MSSSRPARNTTKRLAAVGVAVVVVGLVAFFWGDLTIRYHIWRYQTSDDSFRLLVPQLCERGEAGRRRLLETFAEIDSNEDVASFRVAVFHTLRCMRRSTVMKVHPEGTPFSQDVPADIEAVKAMTRAFSEEPDHQRRESMLLFWDELDFRILFELYGRLAASPHFELPPPMPEQGRYTAAQSGAWCDSVAPSQVAILQSKRSQDLREKRAVVALAAMSCSAGDAGLWQFIMRRDAEVREVEQRIRKADSSLKPAQIRGAAQAQRPNAIAMVTLATKAAHAQEATRLRTLLGAWFPKSLSAGMSCSGLWRLWREGHRHGALPDAAAVEAWRRGVAERCGEQPR